MVTYSITQPQTWGFSNSPYRFIYNLISASSSVTDLKFLGKINYIEDTTSISPLAATISVTSSVAAELSIPLRPEGKGVLDCQLLKSKIKQEVDPTTQLVQRLDNYVRFNITTGFECDPNRTFSNVSNVNGKVGLNINGGTSSFKIGDYIGIDLDYKFSNPLYDGYATISSFTSSIIVTTTNWGNTSSVTQSGDVYYLKRYDTTLSDDFLVEGAVQYDNRSFDLSTLYVWNQTNWSNKRFLTGYPTNNELSSNTKKSFIDTDLNTGQYETIFFLTDRLGDFKNVIVNTYNSNGVNMATYSATAWANGTIPTDTLLEVPSGATSSSNSWRMFELGIGAQQAYGIGVINNFDPPSLSEFFTGVKYYSFRFRNQSNVLSAPIYRQVVCNPSVYVNKQILFKNLLGGWDYINFTEKNSKSITINKNNYKKPLDPTINIYSGNDLRQDTTINVKYTEEYRASTDWMTEDEYNYLNELLTSEDVFIYEQDILRPIMIMDSRFEFKSYQNMDLFILSIVYKYGFDRLA